MTQLILNQESFQDLRFPIILKVLTEEETKKYHLKKFAQWGQKWEQEQKGQLVFGVDRNIYLNGKILAEEPSFQQKQWILHKMKGPAWTWRSWSE